MFHRTDDAVDIGSGSDRGYGVFEERDVDIGAPGDGQPCGVSVERAQQSEKILHADALEFNDGTKCLRYERIRERGNVRAAPVPHLNETQRIQALEGFPNRRPTDAVALGEVALGRQARTGRDRPRRNLPAQILSDRIGDSPPPVERRNASLRSN